MRYYMAPLEGVTTYVYRRAHHKHFAPMDKYFTPFLVPHTKKGLTKRELGEVLPEHNRGMALVPQIMSNDAAGFLKTAEKLSQYGYKEINLNLGCPSRTVVSKYRGAGFLARPEELSRFLDEIYEKTEVEISIKTRIGRDSPEEFERLLEIYNRFPVKELIIHPRIQQDFYRNKPDLRVFREALEKSRNPVCYNGDIFRKEDFEKIRGAFPEVQTVMLGRGLIGNPCLAEELGGKGAADAGRLKAFHDELLEDYRELGFGDKNVLFKMKEIWCYMGALSEGGEKLLKKIKKAQNIKEYREAADAVFQRLPGQAGKRKEKEDGRPEKTCI